MMQSEEIYRENGVLKTLKETIVGEETDELRQRFQAKRDELMARLEGGKTKSVVSHVRRSAEISECGRYRWWLRRSWQLWDDKTGEHVRGKGVCCFVMLNPSTADAMQDDPTIRRCIGFARSWGYDTLCVRNLFPWRATDPKDLRRDERNADIFGGGHGGRGETELLAACTADFIVAAWGSGVPFGRDERVLRLFGSISRACRSTALASRRTGTRDTRCTFAPINSRFFFAPRRS
jgi:hypothetical protein